MNGRRRRGAALVLVTGTLSATLSACSTTERAADVTAVVERRLDQQVSAGPGFGIDYSDLRAVLVTVAGRPVLRRWSGGATAADRQPAGGVADVVLGSLVGIAVAEGRVDLDAPLRRELPAYAADMSPRVGRVSLRRLLTMTGGIVDPPRSAGRPTTPALLRATLRDSTGVRGFAPAAGSRRLIVAVLARAVGRPLMRYARARLLGPLGIRATGPLADLRMRPDDLLRLGRLYLDGGRWAGRQVVPRAWVAAATTAQSAAPDDPPVEGMAGFGFLWWTRSVSGRASYAVTGDAGQLLDVVPSLRLVMVTAVAPHPSDPADRGIDPRLMLVWSDAIVVPAVAATH